MTRITKQTKAIADAHIQARIDGTFDNPTVKTGKDVIDALRGGKTIEAVLDEVEMRFVSITSILMSRTMYHQSKSYNSGVYKGFKELLQP